MDIPLGKSRYGGCAVDLPKGMSYPQGMRFAAQLDLAEFAPFDQTGLLPATGQLIVFADIMEEECEVIYTDAPNNELERRIVEHEDEFWDGVLVDEIFAETEAWQERYVEEEDGEEWDDFAGTEKSKIFGIYTNCQVREDEIEEIMASGKIVLLQIGEDGFNDEGVLSVLIDKDDLKNRNFKNCEFVWVQS